MQTERHVRLFRNGRNQAVRIPREFELDAEEVIMRMEDQRLVIEPLKKKGLLATLAALSELEEDIPDMDRDLQFMDDIAEFSRVAGLSVEHWME